MRVGYVSFRIAGTDGVSLEAERWRKILRRMGHTVTFVAGVLDQAGIVVPQMHFTHPEVNRIHEMVVENNVAYEKVEKEIFAQAGEIEGELRRVLRVHKFDRLVVANVFSLPIHFPLAVALGRVIKEYKIPSISRNHDFWWERKRYLKSSCFDFFKKWFPPVDELVQHVTINSIAQKELLKRAGLKSEVICDCFDFESGMNKGDEYAKRWRKDLGLREEDVVFLQATRLVPRKRIDLAMELVAKLKDPRVILVMAGYEGDERGEYEAELRRLGKKLGIRFKFIGKRVDSRRKVVNGGRIYTLWDCFVNSDFVTYPSEVEGFGNQFVEAVYFKKPIFVNRYAVYRADIEPLGFSTVAINGEVTEAAVNKVRRWLERPEVTREVVEENFSIGRRHFSYEAVEKKLEKLGF